MASGFGAQSALRRLPPHRGAQLTSAAPWFASGRARNADDLHRVDAHAPGLDAADFIFIFGTRLGPRAQILIAAELFERGLAPLIVVTGGGARQPDAMNEAEHHRDVLFELGAAQ